jgi:hypothetical protein
MVNGVYNLAISSNSFFGSMSELIEISPHSSNRNIQKISELFTCIYLFVICNLSIASSIIRLLASSSPDAIIRGIITIVIYSFNGVIITRFCSHVIEKVLKTVPSLTNFNTSSSVISVGFAAFVKTTLSDTQPDIVFGLKLSSYKRGFIKSIIKISTSKTPTRLANSVVNRLSFNYFSSATHTFKNTFRRIRSSVCFNTSPITNLIARFNFNIHELIILNGNTLFKYKIGEGGEWRNG